jgi:predicted HicB family RNase H-like nuclease
LLCETGIQKNIFHFRFNASMTRTKTRTARQSLWLTPEEKKRWSEKAAAASLSLNEYIRCCVERRAIAPVPPEVNRVTAVELGRIGVNLNQLVRAMNTAIASGQEIPLIEAALRQVKALDEAVKKIQLELLRP